MDHGTAEELRLDAGDVVALFSLRGEAHERICREVGLVTARTPDRGATVLVVATDDPGGVRRIKETVSLHPAYRLYQLLARRDAVSPHLERLSSWLADLIAL